MLQLNTLFYKIDLLLNPLDIDCIKGSMNQQYGPSNAKFVGYKIADFDYFVKLHPPGFKFKIKPSTVLYVEITGEGLVSPHIDPHVQCALNYYIEPANCVTAFYKLKSEYEELYSPQELSANTDKSLIAKGYRLSDVECIGEFKANPNEAYLMSTSEIHSVAKPDNSIRKFISYRWKDNSYDEVLQSLI
jgi:hypothetical protein